MVDYFPILKYIPEVFAKWKKEARRVRKLMRASAMAFLLAGKAQYEQMREEPDSVRVEGLIARLLREQNTPGAVKPERSVLKKAQEEADLVAGNKPPTGDMLGQLVYLKACISEILRWRPVTASALPHTLSEENRYGDYFFPKGTTFIANAWTIHRDENDYDRPDEFMPERFVKHPYGLRRDNDGPATEEDLEKSGRRALYAFGSGRRQCPGEQFAFTTVMLAASKAVWAFDVLPPPGGVDVSIETGYKDDIVAEPVDPTVIFKFRDASREAALVEDRSRTEDIAREMLG
ncbi:putative cytochrome p450 [Diaporthe ampelina]|uniref:Putative cytochrome p450 n=1 Tax=Diaporthe ampelina TaxID=1214573 RepID=A0A0G2FH51_9PEZI|nr:putative cytochrome p450 [Diaporthe ampelina]